MTTEFSWAIVMGRAVVTTDMTAYTEGVTTYVADLLSG